MSKQFYFNQFSLGTSTQFNSIWPIDRTRSDPATLGQSGPGSDGNEEVIRISQSSSITETSLLDCLVSYQRHSLRRSYPSAERQSVYSTAPADWAIYDLWTHNFLEDILNKPELNYLHTVKWLYIWFVSY